MDIPEQLRCLYSATVEERADSYVVTVPTREVERGDIQPGEVLRVALLSAPTTGTTAESNTDREPHSSANREPAVPEPPVEEGDQRTVEIDSLGDQGDGITRVDQGFVVIVPETDPGERVIVEITDVQETVAFADVVKRLDYYE
ncbi:MAG: TRAM domain-containing protein [Haloarculaceae archaeon]